MTDILYGGVSLAMTDILQEGVSLAMTGFKSKELICVFCTAMTGFFVYEACFT
ncbi:MAG: hypothetical protein H6619_00550 [Deltaproteobacteria bacterium]|nr:hypothetical protein [Deltaproteobacteria bacterium]